MWRTGDRVERDEQGFLYFVGRTDDVIISAGHRIIPSRSVLLVSHPAVAEAAVVAAPDDERGSVVRAVVVLRDGHEPSPQLAGRAPGPRQDLTAPYKYPRIVDFAADSTELPAERSAGRHSDNDEGPAGGRRPFVRGGGNRWVKPGPPRPGSLFR